MNSPQVSVIIPTYKRPDQTLRAVESALAQTLQDLEIIIIDDASDDGTAEAIERLADPRIKVFRQKENLGPSAARNRGIEEACAPVIAFLDSDDELLPDSVEARLALLNADAAMTLVYSRVRYRLSNKVEQIAPEQALGKQDSFIEALVVRKGLATSAMLVRTNAVRQCLFDERLAGFDDWDVALKLANLGSVGFVEEPLTIIHAEDETEGSRVTFDIDPESELLFVDLHREQFDAYPRAEAAVYYKLAMRAVRAKNRPLAETYLIKTIELDSHHGKADKMLRWIRLGLLPILPSLLRLRWKLLLAMGRVG